MSSEGDPDEALAAAEHYAQHLHAQGRLGDAEAAYRELLEQAREQNGAHHPSALHAILRLAGVLRARRRFEQAEALCREGMEASRAAFAPGGASADAPAELASELSCGFENYLAGIIEDSGRASEAEALYRASADVRKASLGPHHPETLASVTSLAFCLRRADRLADAEPALRQAVEGWGEANGPRHQTTMACSRALGSLLAARWRRETAAASGGASAATAAPEQLAAMADEAVALLRDDLEWAQSAYGAVPAQREQLKAIAWDLARLLGELGRHEEAAVERAKHGISHLVDNPSGGGGRSGPESSAAMREKLKARLAGKAKGGKEGAAAGGGDAGTAASKGEAEAAADRAMRELLEGEELERSAGAGKGAGGGGGGAAGGKKKKSSGGAKKK